MTFRSLGQFVSHHWKLVLACWGLACFVCIATAPAWNDVVLDGEFLYLPESAPSQQGEAVYREAFSHDLLGSTAVIVVRRAGRAEGLLDQDRIFVEDVLKPALLDIADEDGGVPETTFLDTGSKPPTTSSIIRAVRTSNDRMIGRLLNSDEEKPKATLVLIEFTTQFLNRENWPVLRKIETLIAQEGEFVGEPENLFSQKKIPPGLELCLSGPATVGRDLRKNAESSTWAIVQWTLLIGIAGLLVFYRAPLLAMVLLVNAVVSVALVMALLAHFADWNVLQLFAGVENYVLVVLAGVSVLFGMLFVARENAMRFRTPTLEEAATEAVRRAGPVLAGGGLVLFVGWCMLVFAQFGKFQQLGAALLVGAVLVMLSTLTLVPALLVMLGRWALWPNLRTERISAHQTWSPPRDPWSRFMERGWSTGLWQSLWRPVKARPQAVVLSCLLAMIPFWAIAVIRYSELTYGLLSQLPDGRPSVKGAMIIQEQFPAGSTGPVTLLIEHPDYNFARVEGEEAIAELSDALEREKGTFRIADIRSVAYPLGLTQKDIGSKAVLARMLRHREAVKYFVGDTSYEARHATKLEIVFDDDPFSPQSIEHFEALRSRLPELLPASLKEAEWHLLGSPASIRDLKTITDRDRNMIQASVIAGSVLCLFLLFRGLSVSIWLVALAGFNYFAALGATFAAFWLGSSAEFEGLDWKMPTFLFAILMVVGTASYGMLLARIREEQQTHGPTEGLRIALEREGNIYLGGGLILGGLFACLLGGSLVGLKQLGFGLAFGAFVDAVLIRPLLIPACLLYQYREPANIEPEPAPQSLSPITPPPKATAKLTVPPDSDI